MAKFKFANFASSTLAAGVASTDTTFNLAAGTGAKFPTLAAGEYFKLKVINSAKQAEIVKVTAHAASSDQLTVERGQEGTTARAYSAGDAVQLILSKGLLEELLSRNPPVAKSANYTTVVDDNGGYHELGAGVTQVTLGDASLLRPTTADVWSCRFKNVTTSDITIARTTGTDTINRVAGDSVITPGQELVISVNAARNGFETSSPNGAAFTASGTDTYTVTGLSFVAGHDYRVTFTNANATTAPTLNGTTIKKEGGAALVAGDIPAGHAGILRYNGTDFILLNPVYSGGAVFSSSGKMTAGTIPLARIMRVEGYNSASGTIDLGTVNAGDRLLVSAGMNYTVTGTGGLVKLIISISSGTATLEDFDDGTSAVITDSSYPSVTGTNIPMHVTGVIKVIGGGTLVLGTGALATGTTGISFGTTYLSAAVLRSD